MAAGRGFPRALLHGNGYRSARHVDTAHEFRGSRDGGPCPGASRRLTCPATSPGRRPTLLMGNPPHVHHHQLTHEWKSWFLATVHLRGLDASALTGLHVHFFPATAEHGRNGNYGNPSLRQNGSASITAGSCANCCSTDSECSHSTSWLLAPCSSRTRRSGYDHVLPHRRDNTHCEDPQGRVRPGPGASRHGTGYSPAAPGRHEPLVHPHPDGPWTHRRTYGTRQVVPRPSQDRHGSQRCVGRGRYAPGSSRSAALPKHHQGP